LLPPATYTTRRGTIQGHVGGGKLSDHGAWFRERMAERGELTLDELCLELAERGVIVHRSSVGRMVHRLGLSHKKKPDGKRAASPGNRSGAKSMDRKTQAILR
jgi:transposase